jgi:hypothetical protein
LGPFEFFCSFPDCIIVFTEGGNILFKTHISCICQRIVQASFESVVNILSSLFLEFCHLFLALRFSATSSRMCKGMLCVLTFKSGIFDDLM